MWDDALVLLSTDNGGMTKWGWNNETESPTWPASVGANAPLRGGKSTLFEGGVRCTALITGGKNVILDKARGKPYAGLMHAADLFAIAYGAATNGSSAQHVDGLNLLPQVLSGEPSLRDNLPLNINYHGLDFTGIIWINGTRKWKLIVGGALTIPGSDGYYGLGGVDAAPAPPLRTTHNLFELAADPYEKSECSQEHPDVVMHGLRLLRDHMAAGYRQPQPNLPHVRSWPAFHGGAWAPFLGDDEPVHEHDLVQDGGYEEREMYQVNIDVDKLDAFAFT